MTADDRRRPPDQAADTAGPPAVDAALAELTALDGLPVDEHSEVYERAHRRLDDAMADADGA